MEGANGIVSLLVTDEYYFDSDEQDGRTVISDKMNIG